MYIQKVHIVGFLCFREFTIEFNKDKNIIVGNNGTGKSTILDAIHLCLSGQYRGQPIKNSLSPFLFNKDNVKTYIQACQNGENRPELLPQITIEVFLSGSTEDVSQLALFEGDYNLDREGDSGVRLDILFNDEYQEEYTILANDPKGIKSVPIEYYHCVRQTFARMPITSRSMPIRSQLVDTAAIINHRGTIDVYLNRIINERLSPKDRVALSGAFRQMKEGFSSDNSLTNIVGSMDVSDTELSLAIDPSVSTNWESLLIAKINDIPFHYIGKGEQCMTKTHLVLSAKNPDSCVLLLEEPENHLSYNNLQGFLAQIERKNETSQIIITTHSSMVSNKLDLGNLILLGNRDNPVYFNQLEQETRKFFQKVSGFDTLRIVLSPKTILVEGPSDELILQKAYFQKYKKLPLADGIDIISVSGLSFKRYISLISDLGNRVAIVTDNDGKSKKKEERYSPFRKNNIDFFFSNNDTLRTLEPQIIEANAHNLLSLAAILGRNSDNLSRENLEEYMLKHKADAALAILDTDESIIMPDYIERAIEWIKTDS